jgi:hypothetical protein
MTTVGNIPARRVAACGHVSPDTWRKWATHDPPLVRNGPSFTSHDAVEAAIVGVLSRTNQKLAADAWLAVRAPVREHLLAGADDLWLVVGAQGALAVVSKGAARAAVAASKAGEPVYMLPLRAAIKDARERFEAELLRVSKGQPAANIAHIQQGKGSH